MTDRDRPAAPRRAALVETAHELFYRQGLLTVGVDQLVAEASITKATFYKHFPSKELLVRAYVTDRATSAKDDLEEIIEDAADERSALQRIVEHAVHELSAEGFRGDPLLNAAVELRDPEHPARDTISDHRAWLLATYELLLADAGHPSASDAARDLLQARDGAMMTGIIAESADAAARSLQRMLRSVLKDVPAAQ